MEKREVKFCVSQISGCILDVHKSTQKKCRAVILTMSFLVYFLSLVLFFHTFRDYPA